MRADLPDGTVTFLFTDVEGSTKLLHELGAEGYADALAEHRRVIREACASQGGVEVDTQGDAFFLAFPSAPGALAAAAQTTAALAAGPIRVRMGLHTGTPLVTEEGYVGDDVHFAARVAASGHCGQVLVSAATAGQLEPSGSEPQALSLLDLGEHRLKDIEGPVAIFQLGEGSFPPLKTISNTNLPRPVSSFVGRDREVAEVLARVQEGARLLTLTGPGGSGKTRLAIEAAATLVPQYKAGVFWVGLAALRDPALVTETIAQTLGAKDGLAAHIAERELLLLIDNLEQVIAAAPELDTLQSLVEKSLLCFTTSEAGSRYWMLETIREYADEKLSRTPDPELTRRRHAEHFLRVGESLGLTMENLEVVGQQRHDIAIAEQDNFRSAIDWAFDTDLELAVRIAFSLENFWVTQNPLEGRGISTRSSSEPTLCPPGSARWSSVVAETRRSCPGIASKACGLRTARLATSWALR